MDTSTFSTTMPPEDDHSTPHAAGAQKRPFADAANLPLIMRFTVKGTALQRGQLVAYRRHGKDPTGQRGVVLWVTPYAQRDQPDALEVLLPLFAARAASAAEVEAAGAAVTDGMPSDAAQTIAYILDAAAQKHGRHTAQDAQAGGVPTEGVLDRGEAGSIDGIYADVDDSRLRMVLDKLVAVTPNPDGQYMACCPAHPDHSPSLHVGLGDDGKVLLYCFAGCAYGDVLDALELDASALQAAPPPRGCTLEQYAEAKRLPKEWLQRRFGLEDFLYTGHPTVRAIKIPYYDVEGREVLATQYRLGLTKAVDGPDNRFKFKAGDKPCLYNLMGLRYAREQGYVVLVEGASDVHTLQHHGIPAVGVPGASHWREARDATYLQDLEKIYVVNEGDRGGATLLRALGDSILADRLSVVTLPRGYKDASALHIAYPKPADFSRIWGDAIAEAIPLAETERAKQEEMAEQALATCAALAAEHDILHTFLADLDQKGVAGEQQAAALLYLALTSRVLARPTNILVKAVSSAGKSYLVEAVLDFFPPEAYMLVTAMSDKALIYSKRDYRHIFIVIAEASALENDTVSYLIRTLLSEQRLRYHTVERMQPGGGGGGGGGAGQMEGREIIKEGPTGVIVTTTATSIHAENETRHLSVTVDESPEQTRAVLAKIAARRYLLEPQAVDLTRWQALQTWLGATDGGVIVPFAASVMRLTEPVAVRLRRDMDTVLSLIEAHALLHRQTRSRDAEGRVVATLDDYAAMRALVAPLVAEAVEATVSTVMRSTVDTLVDLYRQRVPPALNGWFVIDTSDPQCPSVSLEELTAALQLDKSVVSRRVRAAQDRGFIRNLETRPRQTARLVPGVPMPKGERDVLPTVEAVRADSASAGGESASASASAGSASVEHDASDGEDA